MTGSGSNKNTGAIREMIDHRLKSLSQAETVTLPSESHLDEDTISAFVEGRLGANESKPVLSHLIACGVCRRASAELVRLENQITADTHPPATEEPGRLRAFLSNLPSLVPDGGDEVVFAYQNPEAEEPTETPSKSDDHKKSEGD